MCSVIKTFKLTTKLPLQIKLSLAFLLPLYFFYLLHQVNFSLYRPIVINFCLFTGIVKLEELGNTSDAAICAVKFIFGFLKLYVPFEKFLRELKLLCSKFSMMVNCLGTCLT